MCELVSIVMPSYNTGKFIEQSIKSVINQSYPYWELLIVDDCSYDNTDIIIEPFLNDKRIKYFKNEKNYGAAFSRNRALLEAKGKWVGFLDSDDLWRPRKLEHQIQFMKQNNYYFSYTNYSEIDEVGISNNVVVTGPKIITKKMFYRYCWPGCLTVMYDREYIGLVQIVNVKKNNDYAMWLKICKKADCFLLDEELAYYRRGRTGSISTNGIITKVIWHYKLFRESEKQSVLTSLLNTMRNMIFGLYKRKKYVKRRVINEGSN